MAVTPLAIDNINTTPVLTIQEEENQEKAFQGHQAQGQSQEQSSPFSQRSSTKTITNDPITIALRVTDESKINLQKETEKSMLDIFSGFLASSVVSSGIEKCVMNYVVGVGGIFVNF